MPLTGEAKAKWQKEYQKRRAPALKLLKRQARLKKEKQYNERMTRYNRQKLGSKERVVGKKAKKKVSVPLVRRWVIIDDENTGVPLAYFNKQSGFAKEELLEILRIMREG